jgi:hypothetical protein
MTSGDSEPPNYRLVTSDVPQLYYNLRQATRIYRVHKELDITTRKFVVYVGRKAALQITYDRFRYINEIKDYHDKEAGNWAEKYMKTLTPDRRNEIEKVCRGENSIFNDWEDDEEKHIDKKWKEGDVNPCYPICKRCETLE